MKSNYAPVPTSGNDRSAGCCSRHACCIVSAIVVAVFTGLYFGICYYIAKTFVTLTSDDFSVYDGGKLINPADGMIEHWGGYVGGCTSSKLLDAFTDFNKKHNSTLVKFLSRKAPDGQPEAEIVAWWLPAARKGAPRVVVTHGYLDNFDGFSVQIVAYYLRSMGFSVLAPSLRSHGLSQNTSKYCTFGYAYPYDVLGAFDYAVTDPDGKLGGAMPYEKVGLVGFSMGGFVTATAFGLEPRVPAAWIDSGLFSVEGGLAQGIVRKASVIVGDTVAGAIAELLTPLATRLGGVVAGVDLSLNTPEKALPAKEYRGKPRPIAAVGSPLDNWVPVAQTEHLLDLLTKYPDAYNVTKWIEAYACGDQYHIHMMVWRPDDYRRRLCDFFSAALDGDPADCHLEHLPKFPQCNVTQCGDKDGSSQRLKYT